MISNTIAQRLRNIAYKYNLDHLYNSFVRMYIEGKSIDYIEAFAISMTKDEQSARSL